MNEPLNLLTVAKHLRERISRDVDQSWLRERNEELARACERAAIEFGAVGPALNALGKYPAVTKVVARDDLEQATCDGWRLVEVLPPQADDGHPFMSFFLVARDEDETRKTLERERVESAAREAEWKKRCDELVVERDHWRARLTALVEEHQASSDWRARSLDWHQAADAATARAEKAEGELAHVRRTLGEDRWQAVLETPRAR